MSIIQTVAIREIKVVEIELKSEPYKKGTNFVVDAEYTLEDGTKMSTFVVTQRKKNMNSQIEGRVSDVKKGIISFKFSENAPPIEIARYALN